MAEKAGIDPQILKKNQTSVSRDIGEKILSMYAKGMTTEYRTAGISTA